jgi:hypothetical protein
VLLKGQWVSLRASRARGGIPQMPKILAFYHGFVSYSPRWTAPLEGFQSSTSTEGRIGHSGPALLFSDNPVTRNAIQTDPRCPSSHMTVYRLCLFGPAGSLMAVQKLSALDDEEALAVARETVKGHSEIAAFDLWEGPRKVRAEALKRQRKV